MHKPLLDVVCCPATRAALRVANTSEVDAVNAAITAGAVLNAGGHPVRERVSAAWITADALRVYRVEDGIPVLLADEAILAASIASFPNH